MRSRIIILLCLLSMSLGLAGCLAQDTNGKWHIALSKEAADKIEQGAETAASALSLLSIFVPGLATVAGGVTAGVATYKKMKPKLIKSKAVSRHVVSAIETIKKEQPELWTQVKTYMAEDCDADLDTAIKEVVNVIKQAEKTGGVI